MPQEVFEAHIEEVRGCGGELTSSGLVKAARRQAAAAVQPPCVLHEGTATDLAGLVARGTTFGCIYADPPWRYENTGSRGAAEDHYPTMDLGEIAALPVGQLAAEQAHLHIWTTNAFLFEAHELMEAWGFSYKSMLVWVKPQLGTGNYWRLAHEFLLLGVRGAAPFRDHGVRSWLEADRGRHSAKPEVFRRLVHRVSPGPYLELFARSAAPGWTTWGNQVSEQLSEPSAA